jgi:hypothetical protein
MKSNVQPPLYFSMYPLKTSPSGNSEKTSEPQSPYLKAVLSGNGVRPTRASVVRMVNSDRLAAIRYIKESQWRTGQ